ncbi:MAG: leucine-rich repeat domain-containing protein [Ruminococcus sp.]
MKKILIALLSITVISSAFALSSCSCNSETPLEVGETVAPDFNDNGISYNKNDDGTLKVVCVDDADEIIIPKSYNGMKITKIGRSSFKMSDVKKVILPDTITEIEDFAFSFSSELSEVKLNEGITSIGTNAFSGCKSLKSIELPSTLEYIGLFSFDGSGLENVVIPKNVKTVDEYAFAECSGLNEVAFEGTKTTIAENTFNSSFNVSIVAKKNSEVIKTAKSENIPYTTK